MAVRINALNFGNLAVKAVPVGADLLLIVDEEDTGRLKQTPLSSVISDVFSWSVQAISTTLIVNKGYITLSGGTINLTLPALSAVGDVIRITDALGGFSVKQNAGQVISFGAGATTLGVAGSMTTTNLGDTVEMLCIGANTSWQVISSMGSLTLA